MKKGLGIAVLVLVVVVIIVVVILIANKDKLINLAVDKGVETVETAILKDLPDSIPADSVKTLCADFKADLQSGDIDPSRLRDLMDLFKESFNDQKLDEEEISRLLEELK
ncbi:MAG: hypothetical protein JXB45_10770 [Candidatus Krumholzibacteriota bacterium]|nr:hypothetical protein [Candidatus Krumholzibacteriota bacterium]